MSCHGPRGQLPRHDQCAGSMPPHLPSSRRRRDRPLFRRNQRICDLCSGGSRSCICSCRRRQGLPCGVVRSNIPGYPYRDLGREHVSGNLKSARNEAAPGSKNGRRRRNKSAHNEATAGDGDRLSKLPNDILLNILERVDTLDAIRTCILSKQMLKLPTMLSQFFLSAGSVPGHHDKARVFSPSEVFRTNHVVAHVTDSILRTRIPKITITKLKIRFVLMQRDSLTIAKSVSRAMATQKVGAAEFEILTEKAYEDCSPADLLQFAKQLNNFVGAWQDTFAGLRRLWLCNMRFGELDIPNILSTCKLLESLHLTNCDSGTDSVLQVEHAQLVELEVDYGEFERIELTCLPKLQRVVYNYWYTYEDPLYFGFVPQLSKLNLTKTGIRSEKILELSQLLANVPSLSYLHLDFESEKIWVLAECPKLLTPVLSKLEHVNLENLPEGCDLAWTMFFLEAAPSLKELCITVWDHWCIMATDPEVRKKYGFCQKADVNWKPHVPDFKHKNLVKLTINGFQPDDGFMGYIRNIFEHAVNITEISLYDRKVCGSCGELAPVIKDKVCPSRYPQTDEERKQITEGLSLASRAVVHFCS